MAERLQRCFPQKKGVRDAVPLWNSPVWLDWSAPVAWAAVANHSVSAVLKYESWWSILLIRKEPGEKMSNSRTQLTILTKQLFVIIVYTISDMQCKT